MRHLCYKTVIAPSVLSNARSICACSHVRACFNARVIYACVSIKSFLTFRTSPVSGHESIVLETVIAASVLSSAMSSCACSLVRACLYVRKYLHVCVCQCVFPYGTSHTLPGVKCVNTEPPWLSSGAQAPRRAFKESEKS